MGDNDGIGFVYILALYTNGNLETHTEQCMQAYFSFPIPFPYIG